MIVYFPDDFWHEHQSVDGEPWTECFELRTVAEKEKAWEELSVSGTTVYHGPEPEFAKEKGLEGATDQLMPRLNWLRSFKTDYEIACLSEANRLGGVAHAAANQSFLQGGSELDILYAYLQAIRVREQDLPYNPIICLDEKAAFLHYEAKRPTPRDGKVLLIDAGASVDGYGSDITRTFVSERAGSEFRSLLKDAELMQQELVAAVKADMTVADLHYLSDMKIAELLIKHRVLTVSSPEEAFEKKLTATFYPHGVGHMLGIFVHDVAGRQVNAKGDLGEPDARYPKLRSVRKLAAGNVLTVEPGIYFIETLLEKQRQGEHASCFQWGVIDELKKHGGIRIEDNILVTENGYRNLTREHLSF